jgi:hypothetical protein
MGLTARRLPLLARPKPIYLNSASPLAAQKRPTQYKRIHIFLTRICFSGLVANMPVGHGRSIYPSNAAPMEAAVLRLGGSNSERYVPPRFFMLAVRRAPISRGPSGGRDRQSSLGLGFPTRASTGTRRAPWRKPELKAAFGRIPWLEPVSRASVALKQFSFFPEKTVEVAGRTVTLKPLLTFLIFSTLLSFGGSRHVPHPNPYWFHAH